MARKPRGLLPHPSTEPLCPGCALGEPPTSDLTLVKLMNAGQLNIDGINFQNNKSSDNYSNRVFNGAIYIAEHDDDPDHLMSYLSNIYAEDFSRANSSNYEPVNNAKLEKQPSRRRERDVRRGVQRQERIPRLAHRLQQLTILRPELFNSSGAFSSPTLTINGEYWDLAAHAGGHEYGGRLPVHWAGC